ncbi:hypothetical protein D623_10005074 [Myotis brandtii]|uniref:Uncharacterized protein n=1 Tax=Myotis brandtii TaxID=109478 RepID=S7Q6E7_MYOBR|nr:hypothetical protein D623_10005074 [Myotis brandtii]
MDTRSYLHNHLRAGGFTDSTREIFLSPYAEALLTITPSSQQVLPIRPIMNFGCCEEGPAGDTFPLPKLSRSRRDGDAAVEGEEDGPPAGEGPQASTEETPGDQTSVGAADAAEGEATAPREAPPNGEVPPEGEEGEVAPEGEEEEVMPEGEEGEVAPEWEMEDEETVEAEGEQGSDVKIVSSEGKASSTEVTYSDTSLGDAAGDSESAQQAAGFSEWLGPDASRFRLSHSIMLTCEPWNEWNPILSPDRAPWAQTRLLSLQTESEEELQRGPPHALQPSSRGRIPSSDELSLTSEESLAPEPGTRALRPG